MKTINIKRKYGMYLLHWWWGGLERSSGVRHEIQKPQNKEITDK